MPVLISVLKVDKLILKVCLCIFIVWSCVNFLDLACVCLFCTSFTVSGVTILLSRYTNFFA